MSSIGGRVERAIRTDGVPSVWVCSDTGSRVGLAVWGEVDYPSTDTDVARRARRRLQLGSIVSYAQSRSIPYYPFAQLPWWSTEVLTYPNLLCFVSQCGAAPPEVGIAQILNFQAVCHGGSRPPKVEIKLTMANGDVIEVPLIEWESLLGAAGGVREVPRSFTIALGLRMGRTMDAVPRVGWIAPHRGHV
jgi:hypothetical protein